MRFILVPCTVAAVTGVPIATGTGAGNPLTLHGPAIRAVEQLTAMAR